MNPVWKGYLKINLVTIPVKVYNATMSTSLPSGNTVEDPSPIIVDEAGYLLVSVQIALQAGDGADTSKEVTA